MSERQLLFLIESKRAKLVEVAMLHGFSSAIAIRYSQELDQLLNEYEKSLKRSTIK